MRLTVITGAAGDIGAAVARRLAARGDRLVLVDLDAAALDALRAALPGEGHRAAPLDVSDEAAVAGLAADIRAGAGRVDAVFNNAGINGGSFPIAEHPLDDFRRLFEVNVFGIFLVMKHFLPLAAAAGEAWVLNTSSEAGLKANERRGAYAASKAAILQLTRAAALEYGPRGVRVNALCPGPVEGALMRRSENSLPDPEGARRTIAANCSLGRYAEPDEIAIHACYLLTEAPPYVNGATHLADGCRR
jgi:Dehydrogenases with different specificities (related to short-chain alcohol dehydrogenases)